MFKHEYDDFDLLGDGNYGRSSKCRHPKFQDDLVMQEISLSNLAKSEKEDVIDEFSLITALSHPNITQYRSCFLDKNTLCIVSDYIEGTSLFNKIQNARNSFIDEDTILDWFVQICYAIKYIHDRHILHRNIHPSNIILTSYGVIKLNGFMFAKILDHSSEFPSANYGTPYNMCPETCLGLQYTPKSDIWSLGILLYQLCTLKCSKEFNLLVSSALLIKNSVLNPDVNDLNNSAASENDSINNKDRIDVCTNKNENEGNIVPMKVVDEQNNNLRSNSNNSNNFRAISNLNDDEVEVEIPDIYSNDLRCLIRSMINKDQSLRPSINQILQLDFLRDRIEYILKTFLNRLELTSPSSERSYRNSRQSNGKQRPNLGRNMSDNNGNNKREISQRFSAKKKPPITTPKSSNLKKVKKRPNEGENGPISNPSIAAVGAAGVPVETLSINAVSIDPSSFSVHKEKPKYDIMQSKNTPEISQTQSYEDFSSMISMSSSSSNSAMSSIASKEEFYEMRRKEIKKRQKEKELERQQKMEELAQEAKKRKKELGQMEAPFKKIREISEAAKKNESNEEFLYFALETAKPPPVGHVIHRSISAKDRERETNLIADLINQKRDEVQMMKKKMMQQHDDDVIMIGNVEVSVDKPKYPHDKKQNSGSSTNRSRFNPQPIVDIPIKENNDLLQISAISKTAINIPPSDDEKPIKNSKSSHETGFFYFNGLPIDIPGVDVCSALERVDCLAQFITQGLGQEHFDQARQFVFSTKSSDTNEPKAIKNDEEANRMFKDVFSNNEEMKYFPFVQHLVFCKNYV